MIGTQSTSILIVEDDLKTSRLIQSYLHREAFATETAFDGRSALFEFHSKAPQLVILDVMLPLLDGMSVCTEIRKSSSVPILFLTARDEESDCVLGLGLGADDYMSKPFSPRELVARVKALLRRMRVTSSPLASQTSNIAGLFYDAEKRRFSLNDESLSLTPIEFVLLSTLFLSPGKVFLRNELLDRLYPSGEAVSDRVVDVHIGKLRQKIGDDPNLPTYIHTVRGLGYRFSEPK